MTSFYLILIFQFPKSVFPIFVGVFTETLGESKVEIRRKLKLPFWLEKKQETKSQLTFTCSKSTIETLEKCVKYVQS